jgi:hypothetical protein
MTRCLVRGEAILTQLLFDHALRLRMKDSTDDEEKKSDESGADDSNGTAPLITVEEVIVHAPGAPQDLAEEVRAEEAEAGLRHSEANGSNSEATEIGSASGSKEQDAKAKAEGAKDASSGQGIAGKINVLMAADVEAVVEGQEHHSASRGTELMSDRS